MTYKKCPRCGINYIQENDEYCSVCLDEMNNINQPNVYCIICGAELNDKEYDICNNCLENLYETHSS